MEMARFDGDTFSLDEIFVNFFELSISSSMGGLLWSIKTSAADVAEVGGRLSCTYPAWPSGETGPTGWGLDFDRGAGYRLRRGRRW